MTAASTVHCADLRTGDRHSLRSMPKSDRPARTRKPSAEPTAKAAIPAAPHPQDKRPLLIVAAVLFVGGLAALALWRPWERHRGAGGVAVSAAPPTFVGSQACAGCHANATKAWTDSQHARAMQEATEQTVLGDFARSPLRAPRQHRDLFQARWQVFRPHRRPGWQARGLRGQVHVRRRALAAIPDRAARRSPAGAYRGLGYEREALVQPVPERKDPGARRTALDRKATELEFHLRRLSFDEPAQELRRVRRYVRDGVVGNSRRLRIVPRAGFEPRRLGDQARRRSAHGPDGGARRTRRRALGTRCQDRQFDPQQVARRGQGDRGVRAMPRAARTDRGGLSRRQAVSRPLCSDPLGRACLYTRMASSATKSTTGARSSRARCIGRA